MKIHYLLLLLLLNCQTYGEKPSLVVVFVIDQFPYSIINKIKPHLTGGLKKLLNKGILYTNAHHPHAMPATATGHAALSTGCFAKDHGIIGNSWFNKEGKKIACDDDLPEKAAVFKPDGSTYDYGRSAVNLVMDTVCDSVIAQSNAQTRNRVYAISLKSRAAIMSAGKLGKPFWFDENTGNFTTSKAYYPKLPRWVKEFNKQQDLTHLANFYWKKFLLSNDPYKHIYNGKPHGRMPSLLEKLTPIKHGEKEAYEVFMHTPMANKLVLDCALSCLQEKYERTSTDSAMILWVNISSTDKVGHVFGPDSMEYTDMLYHLDKQLHDFMKRVKQKVGSSSRILWALTSDHGVAPIPEISAAKGFNGHRILEKDMVDPINKIIEEKFGIPNLIKNFKTPQLYLDEDLLFAQDKQTKMNIIRTIKLKLQKHPGIKRAWSRWELQKSCYDLHHFESYYKNQLYPGRSGYISIQPKPFSQFNKYTSGTAHRSPYNYNTHVPLMFYQKGEYQKKAIHTKTWSLQFAPTLAHILQIPKPSGATFNILPGVVI